MRKRIGGGCGDEDQSRAEMKIKPWAIILLVIFMGGCVTYDHSQDDQKLMQSRAAYVQANPITPSFRQAMLSGNLMIGMTREQVAAVLGLPDPDISRFTSSFGESETWKYWRYPVNPEVMYLFTEETQSQQCMEYNITFTDGLLNNWNYYPNCQGIRNLRLNH